jgi:purine-nucleoside phosphorylase
MSAPVAFADLADAVRVSCPSIALVLGSGMGKVARRLRRAQSVPFVDVPGLAAPSVAGHNGCLTLGDWAGQRVLVFEGRLHYYEGCPWRRVVLPVQTVAFLGVRALLATNAAGGIRDDLTPGSLMAVRDHLEWTRPYCWRQPGPGGLGPARPSPYSTRLTGLLREAARESGLRLHEGVYAAVTGPCYETPAEVRALKAWGADAVGMSTTREVQAGADHGLECAAVSCITNRAAGLGVGSIHHGEVLATAAGQGERLADLIEGFLWLWGQSPSPAWPSGGGEAGSPERDGPV